MFFAVVVDVVVVVLVLVSQFSNFNLSFWQLRDVMDPKKHYKRVASQSKLAEKYFQASL